MTIYIDLVFMTNFIGDFLCLWLASAVYRRIPVWRRIISAGVGGIYGAAAVLPGMGWLGLPAVKFAAAIIVAASAYLPARPAELARVTAVFLLSSMLLCGGVEMAAAAGAGQIRLVLTLFGAACLLCCVLSVVKTRIYSRYLTCELCCGGRKVRTCGFYDSGNRLLFGENGSRVIVADERILKKLFSESATAANLGEWTDNVLHIPFSGAAGGVMYGVKLDYVKIDGRRYDDVVLAVSQNHLEDGLVLHSTMV